MENQQLYFNYVSCDCNNKRLYIGYTKKPISSGYRGSYSDKSFKPKHRFDIFSSEIPIIASFMESRFHYAWDVSKDKRFANKYKANLYSSHGCHFDNSGKEREISEFFKNLWKDPEYKAKMIEKACKNTGKWSEEAKLKLVDRLNNPEVRKRMSERCKKGKNFEKRKENLNYSSKIRSKIRSIKTLLSFIFTEEKEPNGSRDYLKKDFIPDSYSKRTREKYSYLKTNKDIIKEVQRLEGDLVQLKSQLEKPSDQN